MLVIEIELLTGRYAATSHDDRRAAEWPPHPARFFSALVAALHDRSPVDSAEREALLWLESQPPPELEVDEFVDHQHGRRSVHDVFVPVNDVSIFANPWAHYHAIEDARAQLGAAEADPDQRRTRRDTAFATKKLSKATERLRSVINPSSGPPSKEDIDRAAALMPAQRIRQMRTFPVAIPALPTFAFVWPESPTQPIWHALDALCERVTRLGHSSSFARCAAVQREAAPNLVPDAAGPHILRVVGPGQLNRLEQEFRRHQEVESRVLPARPQPYAPRVASSSQPEPGRGPFSEEWIVYERCGGARIRSSRGPDLARALRRAVIEMNGANGSLPDSLSGHGIAGPSQIPHIAFISLPNVGHAHADGAVIGCAIVLPVSFSVADRRELMQLLATWERDRSTDGVVELGGQGLPSVRLQRVNLPEAKSLQTRRWCRPSRRFVTATPIALDRHPGNLRSNQQRTAHKAAVEAQGSIADSCERIGLPRPIEVEISATPFIKGVQPVRDFRPWPNIPGRQPRVRVHARLEFPQEVRGPVLLGAGRYYGLGLCLPVWGGEDDT